MSEHSNIEALERFVLDNEALVELESRIGSFNVFDALGVVHQEIKHSHFLSWLLDPGESHGFGAMFLRPVLMDMLRNMPREAQPFNPVELDGAELGGVEVRREWRNIDLLISVREPRLVVAIENKVYSSEHSGQLGRYGEIVRTQWPDAPACFLYLTREGEEPSEDEWTAYSYRQLHEVLTRTLDRHRSSIGEDVRVFVEHYLQLVGSRLMDDEKIKELCEQIYKQHRQAIDLIVEHAGNAETELLDEVQRLIDSQPEHWHPISRSSREVSFVPVSWTKVMPVWRSREEREERPWLGGAVCIYGNKCLIQWGIGWWKDADARERVVNALKPFGLRRRRKGALGPNWNSLGRIPIDRWPAGEHPDIDAVLPIVKRKLDDLAKQLDGSAEAIREALSEK